MRPALYLPILTGLVLPTAMADHQPKIQLSGFGSIAATRTDDAAIGFKRSFQARTNSNTWAFDAESRLGVQLDLAPSADWHGVVQVVGTQREKGNFAPTVEWANAAWEINPSWRLRAGRMVTPVTSSSESREVGYAQLSARAPLETIGIYPMVGHDGADIRYRHSLWDGEVRLQTFAGRTRYKLPFLAYDVDKIYGTAVSYAINDWTLRYAFTKLDDARATGGSYVTAINALLPNLNAIAPYCTNAPCADLIPRVNRLITNWGGTFNVVSLNYDDGNWNLLAEYATRKVNTFISDARSFVTQFGYRINNFTPYIGFNKVESTNRQLPVQFTVSDPALQASADTLANTVSRSLLFPQAANRNLIGLRWDAYRNLALKVQIDQIKHKYPQASYTGFYVRRNAPDGSLLPYDGKVRVYSITADFIF
ncbi:hypothetical protein ACUHMQ_13895 [Chitinimonas sp. PSY-7]|uniref:hypothetical protein n=1 Tax=Chitinimonas sp. PSY-7 TaxID=3459088 RepID=UPI0040402F48